MTGTVLLIVFFVLTGLVVLALAMNGTRRRTAPTPGRQRAQTRATAIGVGLVVAVTGLAVPAAIMVANAGDAAKRGPGGVRLTAGEAEGRELFAARCSQCHNLAGSNSVGRVGPNLDELRPPKALTLDAIDKGRARGLGQMPKDLYEGEDAEHVADFIVRVAGR